ncbi:hypothetical protein, partial [Bacillus sp. AFS014408]|uniref:hypothetical protein n=1 Tax=Bacillus sp. AFS014408 TaxID=2034278 RepID=UPI000BFB0F10
HLKRGGHVGFLIDVYIVNCKTIQKVYFHKNGKYIFFSYKMITSFIYFGFIIPFCEKIRYNGVA